MCLASKTYPKPAITVAGKISRHANLRIQDDKNRGVASNRPLHPGNRRYIEALNQRGCGSGTRALNR
jgi:hypothetical protein